MKKILTVIFVFTILSVLTLTAFAEGTSTDGEYKSIFDLAAEFVMDYSAEILSLLTFIGSLVIAITYKRGLLPRLSGALKGIGSSVGTLRENTEKSIDVITEKMNTVCEESKNTEQACDSIAKKVEALCAGLDEIKGEKCEREAMRTILLAQVDMLYDVFMNSALPQYSKDAVFERINAMKSALSEASVSDE